ncbi:hypothetical protein D9V86_03415 [Bacteroidetes/Chlorobi group bacterium ChocPot_Mid]|jgi:regulatory protein|nr:MAG: hypothetical protein D9V86_03415 [Bacteroidetes/Chlorobi group bacterium ChocPot_Mid]
MSGQEKKITSIAVAKNGKSCDIFVNGELWITTSSDLVLKYKLSKGILLNSTLESILTKEHRNYEVKQTAYNFAAFKPRTEKQVREKLNMKGFSKDEQEKAILFLREFRLLDDEKYAFTFSKEYLNRKNVGKSRLVDELIKRGIEKDLAKKAADTSYDDLSSNDVVLRTALKKMKVMSNLSKKEKKNKLIAYLRRQGFEWDSIKFVLQEFELE